MTSPGNPVAMTPYGQPSKYQERLARITSASLPSPAELCLLRSTARHDGHHHTSGLHYERHHSGWPDIDPRQHELLISGLDNSFVAKPKIFSLEDLQRLPNVSRIHFIECGGNTGSERKGVASANRSVHSRSSLLLRIHGGASTYAARGLRRGFRAR